MSEARDTCADTKIALLQGEAADMAVFAQQMGWNQKGSMTGDDVVWDAVGLAATLTVRPVDQRFIALVINGADASLLLEDLGQVLDLYDDVDVMNEISAVAEPSDLTPWISRLAAFAEGQFQASTLSVIQGLLGSERLEFAEAMASGLKHARWPQLTHPLRELADRCPQLKPWTSAAIASIKQRNR